MVVITWKFQWKQICRNLKNYIIWKSAQAVLTVRSLTYNEHWTFSYAVDCLLEPIFWFVDNFASCLGKMFVFCVTVLTTAVVLIAYWVGLPYWWQKDENFTIILLIIGNWLLLNIVFHYGMGAITPPGYPPKGAKLAEVTSICKKCISPKPPRTHHCSVCDRCILGMDHHCPWLNNCVGYFNARYFYLYMVYMVAGVAFLMLAGVEVGYNVLWMNDTGGIIPNNDPELIGHPVRLNQTGALVPIKVIVEYDSINFPREHNLPIPPITESQRICANPWKRQAVIFVAVICPSVFVALGTLVLMHGRHISRGETSIEAYVNAAARKIDKRYRNPYNHGRKKNWKLFLGLTRGRSFWLHILLPSRHKPAGNGLTWRSVNNAHEDCP